MSTGAEARARCGGFVRGGDERRARTRDAGWPGGATDQGSGQAQPPALLEVMDGTLDSPAKLFEPLLAGGIPGARVPRDRFRPEAGGVAPGAQLLEAGKPVQHLAKEARKRLGDRLVRVHRGSMRRGQPRGP